MIMIFRLGQVQWLQGRSKSVKGEKFEYSDKSIKLILRALLKTFSKIQKPTIFLFSIFFQNILFQP